MAMPLTAHIAGQSNLNIMQMAIKISYLKSLVITNVSIVCIDSRDTPHSIVYCHAVNDTCEVLFDWFAVFLKY